MKQCDLKQRMSQWIGNTIAQCTREWASVLKICDSFWSSSYLTSPLIRPAASASKLMTSWRCRNLNAIITVTVAVMIALLSMLAFFSHCRHSLDRRAHTHRHTVTEDQQSENVMGAFAVWSRWLWTNNHNWMNIRLWNSFPPDLRQPGLSYGRSRQSVETFLFGQWDHGTVWTLLNVPSRNILTYLCATQCILFEF